MHAQVPADRPVTVGVDTHADVHVAAALDPLGRVLGTPAVPTTPAGFAERAAWAGRFGPVARVGIEGTGSDGSGLTRWLRARGHAVVEVDRPNRRTRRRGTSDAADAEAAFAHPCGVAPVPASSGRTTRHRLNRGSDRSWTHGGRRYGGAYEWVDETPRDVRGAIDALRRRDHTRFILAGQSLGCVKVVYAQAVSPIEGVVGIVPRAGPRFAESSLARHGEEFAAAMRAAAAKVAAGDPEGLIETNEPVPGPFAAGAYLEKYGPYGRYDWPLLVEKVTVPWCIILGGSDPSLLVQAAIEEGALGNPGSPLHPQGNRVELMQFKG